VDLLQVGGLDALQVPLSDKDAGVAQDPPQVLQIATSPQIMDCETMPKCVRTATHSVDPASFT
jgi:hypothetical protein